MCVTGLGCIRRAAFLYKIKIISTRKAKAHERASEAGLGLVIREKPHTKHTPGGAHGVPAKTKWVTSGFMYNNDSQTELNHPPLTFLVKRQDGKVRRWHPGSPFVTSHTLLPLLPQCQQLVNIYIVVQ